MEPTKRISDVVLQGYTNLLETYESITCTISDCMDDTNAVGWELKSLFPSPFIGRALTVKATEGDLASVFKAIDLANPDDILVIDSTDTVSAAIFGENTAISAINKGIKGVIIDGFCRDVQEINRLSFPVFCKGVVPNRGNLNGKGKWNVFIHCGGAYVNPGDLIVADQNGIVVVPIERAPSVLEDVKVRLENEIHVKERLTNGATIGQLRNVDQYFDKKEGGNQ
jgi:4-hydroxy-4-methyl-2-oxoglutarate aldolase